MTIPDALAAALDVPGRPRRGMPDLARRGGWALALALTAFTAALGGCVATVPISAPPGGVVLTLFVRNASEVPAQFRIELGPDRGAAKGFSFGQTVGISCNGVPAASRVVLEDDPPSGASAPTVKLVILDLALDLPSGAVEPVRWVDIDTLGGATLGTGVPPWWSGSPSC